MIRLAAGCAFLLLVSESAAAHSPLPGVGAFYSAMLHPVVVPAHALLLFAVGLVCGQHAPRTSRLALPAFALLLAAGLAMPPFAAAADTAALLLALAALAGLAVAIRLPQRPLLGLLCALAGLAIGLDSRADAPGLPPGEGAGVWLGAVIAVTLVGGLTVPLTRTWQMIAVRALGSWITAAAVIVLTLSLASGNRAG
ncbi:MAG: hypothetical protein AcusKO_21320 [Acuticoccus sp.]